MSRAASRLLVIGAAVSVGVGVAAAQRVDSIPLSQVAVGSEIRVWTTQEPALRSWKFIFTGSLPGGISVAERRGSPRRQDFRPVIDLVDLERLDANVGTTRSGSELMKSTLLGAVVGAFVGVAAGMSIDAVRNPNDGDPMALVLFGGAGLGVGSLGGAVAGAQGRAIWVPVKVR